MDTADWGGIALHPVVSSGDFFSLMDELADDESDFMHDRNMLLDAFVEHNLYSLRVTETPSMFERFAGADPVFCSPTTVTTFYMLPCFCIVDEGTVYCVWTHSRARRRGFGWHMVKLSRATTVYRPISEYAGFWRACGLAVKNS
jgi:ribosomal protein S18 acetylase RimI-like enzyme